MVEWKYMYIRWAENFPFVSLHKALCVQIESRTVNHTECRWSEIHQKNVNVKRTKTSGTYPTTRTELGEKDITCFVTFVVHCQCQFHRRCIVSHIGAESDKINNNPMANVVIENINVCRSLSFIADTLLRISYSYLWLINVDIRLSTSHFTRRIRFFNYIFQ